MDSNFALICKSNNPSKSASQPSAVGAPKKDLFQKLHDQGFLEIILQDRTSRQNIIWATDTYASLGKGFEKKASIKPELIAGRYDELMKLRRESRLIRTRKHGEVFTPLSICQIMCDHAYKTLRGKDWQKYILTTVLEITCGEAPFLASRRDLGSGKAVPLKERVGILDRKLQLIGEKTNTKEEWLDWAFKAFESTYGYEFQGDNLLMARMNLLASFEEYLLDRWLCEPSQEEYKRLLNIISWNIWQMDGLSGTLPYGKLSKSSQCDLFGTIKDENTTAPCLIRDWANGEVFPYLSLGR